MREIHTAKGAAFMFSSGLFFCLMSILIKCASANIDIFVLTQTRFVVGLGILGTAAMSGKIKLSFTGLDRWVGCAYDMRVVVINLFLQGNL